MVIMAELYHYGVKGMKWGVRKARPKSSQNRSRRESKLQKFEEARWREYQAKPRVLGATHRQWVETIAHVAVGVIAYRLSKKVIKGIINTVADVGDIPMPGGDSSDRTQAFKDMGVYVTEAVNGKVSVKNVKNLD